MRRLGLEPAPGVRPKRHGASTETRPQRKAYWAWLHKQWRRLNPAGITAPVSATRWWGLYAELPDSARGRVQQCQARWHRVHGDRRALVAVAEVIRPLLASVESGGVERSWRELDRGRELVSYLNAALRAQDILLNREGDLFRRSEQVASEAGRPLL